MTTPDKRTAIPPPPGERPNSTPPEPVTTAEFDRRSTLDPRGDWPKPQENMIDSGYLGHIFGNVLSYVGSNVNWLNTQGSAITENEREELMHDIDVGLKQLLKIVGHIRRRFAENLREDYPCPGLRNYIDSVEERIKQGQLDALVGDYNIFRAKLDAWKKWAALSEKEKWELHQRQAADLGKK